MNTKELDKLNRGRTIRIALPAFLSMLDDNLEAVLSKIVGDFRSGKTDFIAHAAEIATLVDLKDNLLREEQETTNIEGKLHGN